MWNSVSFFVSYANIDGFRPSWRRHRADRRPEAARPLARRTDARVRARGGGCVRRVHDRRRHARVRRVRRRALELVHPPVAPALLERRARGARDALVRARADAARRGADHAVPHRSSLAEPRARRAGVGAPRRRGPTSPSPTTRCSRRSPTCAASSRSRTRRAPSSGLKLRQPLRQLVVEGAAGARAHADELARRGPGQGRRVRPRRRGAAREAEPARARAAARQGASRGAAGAPGGRVRGARRRPLPRGRPRARAGRGARRARRARGLVGRRRGRRHGRARPRRSIPSSSSRAASTT